MPLMKKIYSRQQGAALLAIMLLMLVGLAALLLDRLKPVDIRLDKQIQTSQS